MRNKLYTISVVVPCYNEALNIPYLLAKLNECLTGISHEIILVDDGSTDSSAEVLSEIALKTDNLFYLGFSRNFGHQPALKAGIDHAQGDAVITIDADLQQPPELILKMIKEWEKGADIVECMRIDNKNAKWVKRITANSFYRILGWLADVPVSKGVSDFRLIDRSVADNLRTITEQPLYLRGIISWMGYPKATIEYLPARRFSGKTKYTPGKMFTLAASGITSLSIKPLRAALLAGACISALAFAYGLYALYIALFTLKTVTGWTSTIISVLLLSGIQLLVLGIMGEYIGKMFLENKRRPPYIIHYTNIKKIIMPPD
ncbi:MAG: glycosyltransferase family 2 protein [Bacteroidales bacterium]|nr:glycosyltransferase family 2 protein [Bacteroidales bacterium]